MVPVSALKHSEQDSNIHGSTDSQFGHEILCSRDMGSPRVCASLICLISIIVGPFKIRECNRLLPTIISLYVEISLSHCVKKNVSSVQ